MSKLETKVEAEFSKITSVWEAFRYAKEHDPTPGLRYFGRYYTPATAKETKDMLKKMYSQSKNDIDSMNSKQARMVYHTIRKFLSP